MNNGLGENTVNNLLVVLILLPMITGIILLFLERSVKWQRIVSAAMTVVGFIFSIYLAGVLYGGEILALHIGSFPPPFGITLVGDLFSAAMLVMTMFVATAVLFTSFNSLDEGRERHYFYPFFQFLLMGINGAFLTGDLFNLFVWFEVLLIASYVLVALGGEPEQLQEGFKYVVINVVASVIFLIAIAALYNSLGTLNMADIAQKAAFVGSHGLLQAVALLFLIVFGIKAAIFPLYFWLPRTYVAPPTVVIAFFGGIMTKVGVYTMVRMTTLIFPGQTAILMPILMWVAGLTMVIGILGTIAQMDFKRILSWHIISQIGYMIMGLAIFTPLALAGAIYYIVHVALVKSCLFLVSGISERLTGTTHLEKMGGISLTHPMLATVFLIGGLTLAGVPPSSGFFGKFVLIKSGLEVGHYGIVATAIGVSLFTLFSMIKVYRKAFWGEVKEDRLHSLNAENGPSAPGGMRPLLIPVVALLAVSVGMGLFADFALNFAYAAADQLLYPIDYIHAVLGS